MRTELGHRERFMRAVNLEETDRPPFLYRAEKPINEKIIKKYNLFSYMDILKLYDCDSLESHIEYHYNENEPANPEVYYDIFGNKTTYIKRDNNSTTTVFEPVLRNAESADDIHNIMWPSASRVDMEKCLQTAIEARETDLAVYSGVWASFFTASRSMLGEEKFLMDVILNPGLIEALVNRITDYYLEVNEVYFSKCAKYTDVFYFGSDFGTQKSLFISPNHFRRFFKPNMKRLADHAKGFNLKVMYHTCGAISPILDDIIECGVDIIDPVQVSADGMNPDQLTKYKGRISFHGGISTQTTLPFGTPEQVYDEVIALRKTLGPTGLIVSPDQTMIGDISVENIESMVMAATKFI
jgi:uroporphyrinogen decarboxylase